QVNDLRLSQQWHLCLKGRTFNFSKFQMSDSPAFQAAVLCSLFSAGQRPAVMKIMPFRHFT
ncbi:MAG: hypothetical protein LBT83_09515, partial [Tannerella sp.]|nr:hypothetical protein [Tannerella sp.]